LTGQQILDILNSSVEFQSTKGLSPYYVASGLLVEFNPWAEEGERVLSCKLADGSELVLDQEYEVAYFYGSLPEMEVEPEQRLELSWKEAFISWLKDKGGVLEEPEMTVTLKYNE
jgi:hypothetical protein